MRSDQSLSTATEHEARCGLNNSFDRMLFIRIVTELETYHIYKAVLQTIKVAVCNSSGILNFIS
jgi:hypothetical protein